MSSLEYARRKCGAAPTVRRCPQDDHRSWACSLFSQSETAGADQFVAGISHPLSSFQTVGIATEGRIPIQQGFFRLPQLLQQHCQFAPCRGVCWTNCQGTYEADQFVRSIPPSVHGARVVVPPSIPLLLPCALSFFVWPSFPHRTATTLRRLRRLRRRNILNTGQSPNSAIIRRRRMKPLTSSPRCATTRTSPYSVAPGTMASRQGFLERPRVPTV